MTFAELRPALYRRLAFLLPLFAGERARRLWRRLGRLTAWALTVAYFAFGLSVLLLRYWLLPLVPEHKHDIESLIGQAIGLPVTIGSIAADWQGLNPHLELREVHIADRAGRPALAFDRIDNIVSWWSVATLDLRFDRIDIVAPTLHIRRESDGHLFIAGIPVSTGGSDSQATDWLFKQNIIHIRNASVVWVDALRGAPPLALEKLDFVLDNDLGGRHRFGLTAVPPPALASRLDLRGDLHGHDLNKLSDWHGQLFAELAYADLAGWHAWLDYPVDLPQGNGGLRLWLDVDGRRQNQFPATAAGSGAQFAALTGATADLALRDVRVRLAAGLPELDLLRLDGRLVARHGHDGSLSLAGRKLALATRDGTLLPATDFSVDWAPHSGKGSIQAGTLDLHTLSSLLAYLPVDADSARQLADYAPRGRIEALRAGWQVQGEQLREWSVQGRFSGLGLNARDKLPGFDNLSGDIDASDRKGRLVLRSTQAALDMPAIFAEPRLGFTELNGQIDWKQDSKQLNVEIAKLDFANADAKGSAAGRYTRAGQGAGEIDLTAKLDHGDARAVWRYLPSVIGKDARDWVRNGLTAGQATDTRLTLKGDLAKFPFRDGKGQFLVVVKVDGAAINYAPGWPQIEGVKGEVRFAGPGMEVNASEGHLFGARLGPVRVAIDDFDVPDEILHVKGQASGPTAEFLRFIEKSPVADYIEHFTDDMRASGDGKLDLSLTLPLRRLNETKVAGDFHLHNNQVTIDPALPPLSAVTGRLQFTEGSIHVPALAGNMLGAPLKVVASNQGDALSLGVQGSATIRELRKQIDSPLFDYLSGSTNWRADIKVKKKTAEVVFESNLVGISSSLPEPFNKTASEALPLKVDIMPPLRPPRRGEPAGPREQVRVDLGKVANVVLLRRKDANGWLVERGTVNVGDSAPMPEHGVNVAIKQKRIDSDLWLSLLGDGKRPKPANGAPATASKLPLPLATVIVKTGVLDAVGRRFNDVQVKATPTVNGWDAQLQSKEIDGLVHWESGSRELVRARLKNLTLPDATPSAPGKPADDGDLRELPALDIVADNFAIGPHRFGKLDLQAHNAARTWQIDHLNLSSPDGKLAGKGFWRPATASQPHDTRLEFELEANDIGKLLDRLGFPGSVKRGTASLDGRLQWRGKPTSIDYPSLSGDMKLSAKNGQFAKLEPGIGKLLGLLSLQSLPRRITLDFRDVFSDGFAFDAINGTTSVQNGLMKTDNLMIEGPAAKVTMSGEVDIGQETQRLKVRVQPAIGNSVALGAALFSNPVTGVATLLAQKFLKNPLDQVFSYEYMITGAWDDPKVDKLGQELTKEATKEVPKAPQKEPGKESAKEANKDAAKNSAKDSGKGSANDTSTK